MKNAIVWFRQDLRLKDNPALFHAAKENTVLTLVYIDDTSEQAWQMGAASRWWLRGSLGALQRDLQERYGISLILKQGDPLKILQQLIKETQSDAVYWNRCYEPASIERDKNIKATLTKKGISVNSYNGALLLDPWLSRNKQGEPFKVFTPFWKSLKQQALRDVLNAPKKINATKDQDSLTIDDIAPLPSLPWYQEMASFWQIGEKAAQDKCADFLKNTVKGYKTLRDRPDLSYTSLLSPHLHFGEISPIQIWYATHGVMQKNPDCTMDADHFLSELAWREFSYHLLYHFPDLPEAPFKKQFAQFPWNPNPKNLKKWQQGQTGYPIVDAGMRQLWHTGWMHNRVRMIVASFLIKDLLIPWQAGEAWFWDCLVDADLASNAASWQWVAGSGADAAPYFRIFNPILQGEKFDANGEYVKKWVPELVNLPAKYIHHPSEAPAEILKAAGIELGKNYPKPMVDHGEARKYALESYKKMK